MNLEQSTASLNALYFLLEFTYTNATFRPSVGTELELADGLIWLDDAAVIFQMKERSASSQNDKHSLARWFQKKVVGEATKQIRDTIRYLDANRSILAKNGRGQSVLLEREKLKSLHKVVLYSEPNQIFSRTTHHISSTAGFIHILPLVDYDGLVRTLCTPSELFEYLTWRESLLKKWITCSSLPEQALVGHYLWGDPDKEPVIQDIRYLNAIDQDIESFDLTGILHRFLDRAYDGIKAEDTKYHRIIGEVAKLDRSGCRAFKERFKLSMDKAKENVFTLPFRFTNTRTDCGFVFIPLEGQFREKRLTALTNLTHANKYDGHLSKCIGLTFLADPDGLFTVDWCFIDSEWQVDPEMEKNLNDFYPFRPAQERYAGRYQFSGLPPE
jgi:hypothetical protein